MRAEPSIVVFAQKHHGHAIVNATNERIRLSDDYSRRQDLLATETRELPDASEGKGLGALAGTLFCWLLFQRRQLAPKRSNCALAVTLGQKCSAKLHLEAA